MTLTNTKTVADRKIEFEKYNLERENHLFEKAKTALQMQDLSKTESRTFTVFSKDKLRTYMQNPFSNSENLRQLSLYLYRMSNPYRRLINYNASMIDLNARSVIPNYNPLEKIDPKKTLDSYYKTLFQLNKMDLANEILKMCIIAWREDTAYGVCYEDDTGFFILPFDGQYCKVSSVNYDGTLNWAVDCSYFRTKQTLLEYYGEPFVSLYRKYESDSNLRWQEVDPSRTICLKINIDDPTFSLPPYVTLFSSIIDLCDLQNIQSVKDKLSIYKLLVFVMKTITSSKSSDDFSVSPDIALPYFNRILDSLPEEVAACISPLEVETIEFNNDQTKDVNSIEDATKNLFNSSGGAQILNSSTISGTTAFTAAIKADSKYATGALLPQLEKWTNRYLTYTLGEDHAKVKYLDITPFTKDEFRKNIREDATYGLPNRLALNSLSGFSELETLSLLHLEQDILHLHTELHPLQSSHTQSSSDNGFNIGRPESDDSHLTDDGEASREKSDNKK